MIDDITAHVGILTVSLHIPHAQSLKDKRTVIKSLKDKIASRFNVSVAEIGELDKWQLAILGIAAIGNDNRFVDSSLQNILGFIEAFDGCELCEHKMEFV